VEAPCFLCGSAAARPVWSTADRAFGVPGVYTVARCLDCGFLYQRPRIRDEWLAACYPDDYPRHREASPRAPWRGSPGRQRAVRWALAHGLGYGHLGGERATLVARVRARLLLRRLRWDCPAWIGQGRYLDVGCGSGAALGVARALGWTAAGIEMDAAAAERARRFSGEIFVGDIMAAPLPAGRFDALTKRHLILDFTKIILLAEGKALVPEAADRVWVTIVELKEDDWGIGGHTDWLRDYESALDTLGVELKPRL